MTVIILQHVLPIILTDRIPLQSNLLFIGDCFLRDLFRTFAAMRCQAEIKGRCPPYVFDKYNVECYTAGNSFNNRNAAACILNSFIDYMNNLVRIPSLIVIIPDQDILLNLNHFNFGISYMSGCTVDWLCKEIEKIIEAKVVDFRAKKAGSVKYNEPSIIWVSMIERPYCQNLIKFKSCTAIYNPSLQESVLD